MAEGEASWRPIWIRGGKIEHATWIGKEVLAWCLSMHIIFYNIPQKRESLWSCSKVENGDGVSCLAGHPTILVLAFAEKGFRNQKIFVLSYPSMKTVSECVQGSENGYTAIVFTSTEHLISLSSHPQYALTLWSWRTGESLASVDTPIHDIGGQIIEVSYAKPPLVAQLGQHSGKLIVWETSPAGKTILLTGHDVTLPGEAKPYRMDWSLEAHEPLLAIVDSSANVYIANYDGSQVVRAVLTQRCGICPDYEAPSVRWFRNGIVLRTTFCQIRFYKKDAKNSWRKDWYVKSILKPSILSVHPLKNTRLFYHTYEGFLMELTIVEGQENPVIERKLYCGGIYSFADIVHPWGHHLVAIHDTVHLSVLNSYDGREVAKLNLGLEGEIVQLLSHPDYPLVAVTSKKGELVLLSLHSFESPFVIGKFNLQSERLDLLKFSQCGNYLVIGQRTTGVCYCLSLTLDKPFVVIARLETKCRMTDVLLYDTREHLKLFVLAVSSRKVTVGHHLIVYVLSNDGRFSAVPLSYLELPYGYQFLHYAPDGVNSLIGTAYLSRQFHLFEIKDWREVSLVDAVFSGHAIRRARLCTDRSWITSAAFDGRVILRDGRTRKLVAALYPHHRKDLGTVKALVDASGDLIISLGRDGSLVTMKSSPLENSTTQDLYNYYVVDFGEYEKRRKVIEDDYCSLESDIVELLSKRIDEFPPPKDGVKKTWIEWDEEVRVLQEAEACAQQKTALYADFTQIQNRLVQLLYRNEICPEIERLPIATFDLDKSTRDLRLKVARDEREDVRLEMEKSCVSMDRVTSWIKSTFWDSQSVIGRSIFTIFDNVEVANYATTSGHAATKEMLQLARFVKDATRAVADLETFYPWKLYTPSQLQLALQRRSGLHTSDERQRMDALLAAEDDEERNVRSKEVEDRLAKEGMTTHRFIEQLEYYYSQFECYGFAQLLVNSRNLVNDCQMLREYFNKIFDDTVSLKEREMSVIHERHERIRYIDSELRTMFSRSASNIPIDPDWKEREQPDGIVKVLDREVKVRPYVSPSQQELLDRQAVEAEELRQLSLADDFRERCLMRMMDGVLEVRWEDIIKRDIPKPQCMLTKAPDEYNAEDLLAIRQYDKDVEFLQNERTRYHRMLETELTKIKAALLETTEKFNARIYDLSLLKMHIESAIQQLNLRNMRDFNRHVHRMQCLTMDDEIRGQIAAKTKTVGRRSEELRSIHDLLHEYRNQHEAMVTREKTMEKKFRSDFPLLGRASVELLENEYKHRPRTSLKNATTSDLTDLGRAVSSRVKVTYLSQECAEYLKNLEVMDTRPASLPVNIDAHHWDHLIRMRRTRIELEMKTRSQMVDIHETEKTIAAHERELVKLNADMDMLKERLVALRQERRDFDQNMEVQLVLKMGQIEVHLDEQRDDAANALLVPRSEIESINEKILNAGRDKLKTMNHAINFHRVILLKEWEHKCLKMKIEDLEEELHTVESVLVTRDMREFLNKRQEETKDDNTAERLEKELETMKKVYQRQLNDWSTRLGDVEAKIKNAKHENDSIAGKITRMNFARWELESQRDMDGEMRRLVYRDRVFFVVKRRAKLVRQLHQEYMEVLALQTEHELIRLRKYPILNFFKTLDD